MKNKIVKDKWLILKMVMIISALIPLIITTFELITTDKESVIFLEGYPYYIGLLIITYYSFLIVLGILWLINQVVKQFKATIKLRNENKHAELLHLKSQVNPHFFFNVLNNLYGLVGQDAEKAQKLILKLSDLMRYSIYEGQKEMVSVSDEVDYLKNYIELNEMRYHKKIDIRLNYQLERDNNITPLLLIILIENAFKHGVETLRENAFVHIHITSKADSIDFSVVNNFDDTEKRAPLGIGLNNLKRRLELIYPEQHKLSFSTKKNIYTAQLNLLPR